MAESQTVSEKAGAPAKGANASSSPRLKSDTIAQLRIIISPEIEEVTLPARGDKEERTIYNQRAMVLGGPTNIPFTCTAWDKDRTYKGGGLYVLTNGHIRAGNNGRLELDPFLPYTYLAPLSDEYRMMLTPTDTDLSDLLQG